MKLTRTIRWTLTAALAAAGIGGALYAQERYDEKVRNLFFAGFRGDTVSLDKGMKITEDTLAAEPKHAEARVWHGAGVFFRAGMAFQKGDVSNGAVLWQRGLEEMREAVGLAPDNLGVRIPRGAVLLTASHNVPPNMAKPLLETGLTDFEHAYKLQERIFHTLGTHPRGELMIGMASAYDRLGQKEKAREWFERMAVELPGTPYETSARLWMETRSLPANQSGCLGCHVKQ